MTTDLPTLNLLTLPGQWLTNGEVDKDKLKAGLTIGSLSQDTLLLWCHQALMLDLLDRLPETEPAPFGPKETHLDHLKWMLTTASETEMAPDKAARWLAYVQGVATVKGWIDVNTERDRTRPLLHLTTLLKGQDTPQTIGRET